MLVHGFGEASLARRRMAIFIGAALILLAICQLTEPADAHPAHQSPSFLVSDGRLPGQPDFVRTGDTTFRFIPAERIYEIRKPGQPITFAHVDLFPPAPVGVTPSIGGWVALPPSELNPVCRSSDSRIAFVYTHRPFDKTPTSVETIRNIAKRMNWKINDQSSQSSGGSRTVKLIVDCTGAVINVYDVSTSSNDYSTVYSTVQEQLGSNLGSGPIKYLVFDSETAGEIGGLGNVADDNRKSWLNSNAQFGGVGLVYNIGGWATHVPIHELFHTLGASQGFDSPPAPFSTPGNHCTDGIDILCYADGTGGGYTETSCPESAGYYTPVKVPIDCNNDTYFDAAPQPTSWLDEYWNVAGNEDPFLAGPPLATSGPVLTKGATYAAVEGEVDSGGYDTTYYAEYGISISYGSQVPIPGVAVGASEPEIPVQIEFSGLKPKTTYHYRLVASNVAGKSYGEDRTLTTLSSPPAVITDPASGETDTEATLRGRINPEGQGTSYQFEYGTTTAYGSKTPIPVGLAGYGTTFVSVSKSIGGLTKGTIYHYRLTATNEGGTTYGEDQTFTSLKLMEYPLPSGGRAVEIASGSDGNLWFTAQSPARIGKVTPSGQITEYPLSEGSPLGIAAGPDGNLWFTKNSKVGKISTSGTITEYAVISPSPGLRFITAGPDGNLWFTEGSSVNSIGKITTAGSVSEYRLPTYRWPEGITTGPDGNIWYVTDTEHVGKMSTSGVILGEYSVLASSSPRDIVSGPDGKLWFTMGGQQYVGKVSTAGAISNYSTSSFTMSIAAGPDGNMWFTMFHANKLARITTSGTVTEYAVGANPAGLTVGPDGKLWFTTYSGKVGKLTP
jgi:streptogramin lyase